jgi:MYXO-CTERM domain-containing protein
VTIDATDIAGHTARLDAGCVALPAELAVAVPSAVEAPAHGEGAAQPASGETTPAPVVTAIGTAESEELPELAFETDVSSIAEGEGDPRFAESAGCSVASTTAGQTGNLAWLTLALGWLVRRSRKR